MGEVVQFKSGRGHYTHLPQRTRLVTSLSTKRWPACSDSSLPTQTSGRPEAGSPLGGIAIIVCATLMYALLTFHLTGQPSYSARANLSPAVIVQD